MRAKGLLFVLAVTSAIGVLASSAMASGPAAPGKQIITIDCQGIGPVTVSVQRGENSNGAGQVVDASGHGIPAAFSFTLTDVTTNTVIDSEGPSGMGNGHSHPNQPTVSCSGVQFDGTASDFFGAQLPPNVAATDEILATFTVDVILKNI